MSMPPMTKMTEEEALVVVNKIFKAVFNVENRWSLETILRKFAFDVKLPQPVKDATTGETTWSSAVNAKSYITDRNSIKWGTEKGWMLPKQEVHDLGELIKIWQSINLTTAERVYDSVNIGESDPIYRCENVFRSTDCSDSKNLVFCDSCGNSEFLLASQRSGGSSMGIRVDDSGDCSNSYVVVCSKKVTNSLFIQDAFNLHECMFCSHLASKKYCIANMQFEEAEYFAIKKVVIEWILSEL